MNAGLLIQSKSISQNSKVGVSRLHSHSEMRHKKQPACLVVEPPSFDQTHEQTNIHAAGGYRESRHNALSRGNHGVRMEPTQPMGVGVAGSLIRSNSMPPQNSKAATFDQVGVPALSVGSGCSSQATHPPACRRNNQQPVSAEQADPLSKTNDGQSVAHRPVCPSKPHGSGQLLFGAGLRRANSFTEGSGNLGWLQAQRAVMAQEGRGKGTPSEQAAAVDYANPKALWISRSIKRLADRATFRGIALIPKFLVDLLSDVRIKALQAELDLKANQFHNAARIAREHFRLFNAAHKIRGAKMDKVRVDALALEHKRYQEGTNEKPNEHTKEWRLFPGEAVDARENRMLRRAGHSNKYTGLTPEKHTPKPIIPYLAATICDPSLQGTFGGLPGEVPDWALSGHEKRKSSIAEDGEEEESKFDNSNAALELRLQYATACTLSLLQSNAGAARLGQLCLPTDTEFVYNSEGVADGFFDKEGVQHEFEEAGFVDKSGDFFSFSDDWLASLSSQSVRHSCGDGACEDKPTVVQNMSNTVGSSLCSQQFQDALEKQIVIESLLSEAHAALVAAEDNGSKVAVAEATKRLSNVQSQRDLAYDAVRQLTRTADAVEAIRKEHDGPTASHWMVRLQVESKQLRNLHCIHFPCASVSLSSKAYVAGPLPF